jgi:hypothetical protein
MEDYTIAKKEKKKERTIAWEKYEMKTVAVHYKLLLHDCYFSVRVFFLFLRFQLLLMEKWRQRGWKMDLFLFSLPHVTKCLENKKKKSIRCCVLGSSWWCTSRRWIWEMVRYVMWTGVLSVGLAMCICWHRCSSTCSNIVPADNVFTAEIFDNHSTYYWNLSKKRERNDVISILSWMVPIRGEDMQQQQQLEWMTRRWHKEIYCNHILARLLILGPRTSYPYFYFR